jgi:hypothetical protein
MLKDSKYKRECELTCKRRTVIKPDIPAFRHFSSVSMDRDFGPSVATIFVSEGKNFWSSIYKRTSVRNLQMKTMYSIL